MTVIEGLQDLFRNPEITAPICTEDLTSGELAVGFSVAIDCSAGCPRAPSGASRVRCLIPKPAAPESPQLRRCEVPARWNPRSIGGCNRFSRQGTAATASPDADSNASEPELMQYRRRVGGGPSLKTCPR